MGKMKEIYTMLKGGASNDTVAYWIFNNTKVGDEQQNNEDREEIDETE